MTEPQWLDEWVDMDAPVTTEVPALPPPAPDPAREARWRLDKRILIGLGTVLALLLLWGGFIASRVVSAVNALEDAAADLPGLEAQIREDPWAVQPVLERVQAQTRRAARATGGGLYNASTNLPFVGDDLAAVRTVSSTADRLVSDVLPRLTSAIEAVNPETLAPVDGRVDLAPFMGIKDEVISADDAVRGALADIQAVDRQGLMGPLASAMDELQAQVLRVSQQTKTASRAVQLLPPMLGADGPRQWIVLAQNPAEQRPLGGIVGAVLTLTTDDGRITKGETANSPVFQVLDGAEEPILPATEEEEVLFADQLGRFIQNVTGTPDFPRAAEFAQAMVSQVMGIDADGVIAFDPVALQSIIGATGDISFVDPLGDTVTLTADNTANFLLSEVYQRYPDPDVQDEVFAEAAGTIFSQMTSGGGFSAQAIMDALDQAATQGRLMVWSAHPEEQALLQDTILSGALRGTNELPNGEIAPVVGIYTTLLTQSKLGFYIETTAEVTHSQLLVDGSQEFQVSVTFHNSLTPEIAATLPDYVIGEADRSGINPLMLYVTAPTGGTFDAIADGEGREWPTSFATLNDLEVAWMAFGLSPGDTFTLNFDIWSGPDQPGEPVLRITPGVS